MTMKYKLTDNAIKIQENEGDSNLFTPTRGTPDSAGLDLKLCVDSLITVFPGEYETLHTGVCLWLGSDEVSEELKDNDATLAALMLPRSSMKGLQLTNAIGLIDSDYQGEYLIKCYNYTDSAIVLKPFVSLVQVIIIGAMIPKLELVAEFDEVTSRGAEAFGHTGNTNN